MQRSDLDGLPSTAAESLRPGTQGIEHISPEEMSIKAQQACSVLKQLANEQRLMVLCHLIEGEKTVSELQSLVGLEQSSLSQHLAKLRNEGLICARRDSQSKYYSIIDRNVLQIIELLHRIYCSPTE